MVILLALLSFAQVEESLTHDEAVIALKRAGVKVGRTRSGAPTVSITYESDKAENSAIASVRFLTGQIQVQVLTDRAGERLSALVGIKDLRSLTAYGGDGITDDSLRFISDHKNLTRLELISDKLTDAGLVHLETLKNLESLRLVDTAVTKAGIEKLYKSLPKCVAELD